MDDIAWYIYPAVVLAGFAAGFINTLAGSGSLITLAVLIFMGIPANVANGTNRIGVLVQSLVSAETFRRQDMLDLRGGLMLSVPAIIGSLIGAQIAVNLDETMMRRTIGALMVIMLIVILVRPRRWLQGELTTLEGWPNLMQMGVLFLIGAYGGFIQAGVGIFLLAGLVLSIGYDLVRANAVKVLMVVCFTVAALIVFVINDQVLWGIGILLAIGNAVGGWLAARMAVDRGAVFVRWLLIAVIVISAVRFLGVVEWITGLF